MKQVMIVMVMVLLAPAVYGALSTSTGEIGVITDAQNTRLTFVSQIPDPAEPGGFVELRWKIENFGGKDIDNIVVELLPEFPFSLEPGDDGKRKTGSVHARQIEEDSIVVFYTVLVHKDAVEGDNLIRLRYSLDNGKTWQRSDPFTVRLRTQDAILSVADVKTEKDSIRPGEITNVNIVLRNYGDSLIKDVQFALNLVDAKISPVASTNKKIVEHVDANKMRTLNFKLVADADAESKVHKIPYSLDYLDNLGNKYNKTGTIGIVINEEPQYTLNVEDVEIFTANAKGKVVVSVSNVGSSEIKFMTVGIKPSSGYEILSSQKVYIGNIESDDFETAEFEIFAQSKEDLLPLAFTLDYKDSYNKAYEDDVALDLNLYSRKEAQKLGLVPAGSAGAAFFSFVIFIVTSVFWLFMLVDLRRNRMMRYQKWLWFVLVFFTHVIGAVIYYFIGRKKELGKR